MNDQKTVIKFTKVMSGWYRFGRWNIEKRHGAWLVSKGAIFSEHSTWEPTLKDAKKYIQMMEAK